MPSQGPIPAEIAVVCDWSDYSNGFNINPVINQLHKLGISTGSLFVTTILEAAPPRGDDGKPDIDKWISKRKTCPGPGWNRMGDRWASPECLAGRQALLGRLAEVKPKLVIALGELSLLALTGASGIDAWHGSRLAPPAHPFTVVPCFHPRRLLVQPSEQFSLDIAISRAYNIYTGVQVPRETRFIVKPTFRVAVDTLLGFLEKAAAGPLRLSSDVETRSGHIACHGIAWSPEDAICIPHLVVNQDSPFYWSLDEEAIIVSLYIQLFSHPNITWIGQNFLYDCQYFHRHWGVVPLQTRDTMIGHHALHSNIRKGLDFLSFMYSQDHVYWKDEIKEWDPKIGETQYWIYNCKDAVITFEIWDEVEKNQIERTGAAYQHTQFQQSLFFPVLRMMNRGLNWDKVKCLRWTKELLEIVFDRQQQLNWLVGHDLNPKSPAQLLKFFYDDLGIPGIKALGKETNTTNSPTLALIAERDPLLRPLCQLILELRSLGVFQSNFLSAGLDVDGRMRTSFGVAGPTTYRFNSRENAFYNGLNVQNIPVKEKQKLKTSSEYVKLPNIRELFLCDTGKTFFDIDCDRGDMQIVGWESGDANLKLALRKGIDLHCMSAAEIFGIPGIPPDELVESHPNYLEHRNKIGKNFRDRTKNGGHAVDYGVGDRKLAQTLGITVHEASIFKAKWFGLYPGIRAWHLRVEREVREKGFIENPFGARLYLFGRFNLPEFLGWVPQSTVAGVINRALVAIDTAQVAGETTIELQLQVHDSLAGQFATARKAQEIENLKRLARILVPYEDPLYIPIGVKTSNISWGHCA